MSSHRLFNVAATGLAFVSMLGCSLERSVLGQPALDGAIEDTFVATDGAVPSEDAADFDSSSPDAETADADLPDAHDGGSGPQLDLFSGGTFVRATEASYLVGPPTNGSAPFLAWAPAGMRRIEDRGDGSGPMLLIEGARTNFVTNNRDASATSWTLDGVLVAGAGPGPDGQLVACANNTVAGARGTYVRGVGIGPGAACATAWVRQEATGSSAVAQVAVDSAAAGDATVVTTIGPDYTRAVVCTSLAVGGPWLMPWAGSSAFSGGSNVSVSYLADLTQFESGTFPSSAIRTAGVVAHRDADELSYGASEYPSEFLVRGFTVTVVPEFGSAQLGATDEFEIVGMASRMDGALTLAGTATGAAVMVYQPGVGRVSEVATWFAGQPLTLSVRPGVSVQLSGFATGDGTYSLASGSWNSGVLWIGSDAGGNAFFGRFARYITGN